MKGCAHASSRLLLAAFAVLAAPALGAGPDADADAHRDADADPDADARSPAPERSDEVKAIYRDYRRDGEIDACKHKKADLKEALKDLTDEDDAENPDLRYLLEARSTSTSRATASGRPRRSRTTRTTPAPGPATTGDRHDRRPTTPVTPVTPVTPTVPDSTSARAAAATTPRPAGRRRPHAGGARGDAGAAGGRPALDDDPARGGRRAPLPPRPAPVYTNADDSVPLSLIVLAGLLGVLALIALAAAR